MKENLPVADFELEMRLRNNHIRKRRKELGLSVKALAEAIGASYPALVNLENLRLSPVRGDGQWRGIAVGVADYFGVTPTELFPEAILAVASPRVFREISSEDVAGLLPEHHTSDATLALSDNAESQLVGAEMRSALVRAMETLRPRECKILRLRFFEDRSAEEIGEEFEIGVARVHQIIAKAIRKLRHPSRTKRLRDFFDGDSAGVDYMAAVEGSEAAEPEPDPCRHSFQRWFRGKAGAIELRCRGCGDVMRRVTAAGRSHYLSKPEWNAQTRVAGDHELDRFIETLPFPRFDHDADTEEL